ncbi:protein CcdB [Planctomycetota bacterium]|nr:protein CcdB [Planctomycetota bacterium]
MTRVLIVDDALFMRRLIRQALEPLGYDICAEACDGEEAITLYRQHRPDVTTLDMVMPIADGIAALTGIRTINPQAKVIMVTAVDQREAMLRAVQLGVSDFIVKPFSPERIVSAIDRALGGAQ